MSVPDQEILFRESRRTVASVVVVGARQRDVFLDGKLG